VYKNPSFIKYKNPSFIKYKNSSFIKYKNLSFIKYKNPSFIKYKNLSLDQQGHVYISGYDSHDIHRLSPDGTFRDIVLSEHDGVDGPRGITFNNDFTILLVVLINCMDLSSRRVTTALSVHGTTVIPQGRLVNDISSSYICKRDIN
jgi:hypothetical protein